MTNITKNEVPSSKFKDDVKLHVVYRLDFAMKLKEMGHIEAFNKRNPQKPWLYCWYFVETESFLTDLQRLMEGSKNGR